MVDGRLTKEERACLIPLDAADETRMGHRKAQRIMGKSGIMRERRRRRPCGPIGQDGEPGIRQSMSRRTCCRDDACIGTFWGRMKEQMGDTAHLPPRRP